MGKLWKISSPFHKGACVSWNVRGSKSGEKAVHGQGRLFTGGGQGHACSQEAAGRRRPQFGVPCRCRGGQTQVPQVRGKSDDENQVLSPSPVPQTRVHPCQPGSSGSWEEWPSAGALCTGVLPWARRLKRVPPHLRGRLAASGRKREAHA